MFIGNKKYKILESKIDTLVEAISKLGAQVATTHVEQTTQLNDYIDYLKEENLQLLQNNQELLEDIANNLLIIEKFELSMKNLGIEL